MKLTSKIQKAINMSATLHKEHSRIGLNIPYIVHPFSVACLVSQYSDNEDLISAALLHDVLEDADGYDFKDLKKDFGINVAKIVKEVTEDRTHLEEEWNLKDSWKKRKSGYLKNLRKASMEALLISAADTIHNLRSLKEIYELNKKKSIKNFQSSIESKTMFYGKVIAVISKRLDSGIVSKLQEAYSSLHYLLAHDS